ncbi:acetyltransferase [Marinobacterium aestuarii]|uniref:Acetyltransferase n=1 Tax=Marinobacterium aestuarii TaxID=1821621 RepID=A0A1A9EYA9_9GAMM|nr:N-acetyltransferase [Marinobacterium aestuarii]ANG62812.1 acetyltransferase [Marinobacterium aestuarii]
MNIREEKAGDGEAIETLTYQAFENHPHHEPGALTLSLVAEEDGAIVGQITFSPVTINGRDSDWFGLGPVSVKPERQGEGIGSQLIRNGLERLKKRGAGGVVLLGEPAYYGRFGFKANPDLTLPGVPAEYFVIQVLRAGGTVPKGVIGYHRAFG